MLDATEKAIGMPENVIDEYNLEIAGRVRVTPVQVRLGRVPARTHNCRSVGIPSSRLDELRAAIFV